MLYYKDDYYLDLKGDSTEHFPFYFPENDQFRGQISTKSIDYTDVGKLF